MCIRDSPSGHAAAGRTSARRGGDPDLPGHVERLLLPAHPAPGPGPLHAPDRAPLLQDRGRLRHHLPAAHGHGGDGHPADRGPLRLLPALLRRGDRRHRSEGLAVAEQPARAPAAPRLGGALRGAAIDFYFNSWRLVPANLAWSAGLVAILALAATVSLLALLLVPLLALPTVGTVSYTHLRAHETV